MTPRQFATLSGLLLNLVIAAYLIALLLAGLVLVDLHRDIREQRAVDAAERIIEDMRREVERVTR